MEKCFEGFNKRIKIEADLHTHSLASGHAYSTIEEMVKKASEKGLKVLGITDHGPALPDAPHKYYFSNMVVYPKDMYGVRILSGIEANIIDAKGKLDLPEEYADRLDIILAGFHYESFLPDRSVKRNTEALLGAMENKWVKGIAHPCNPAYPVDFEAIVRKAAEKNILIEINNSSLLGQIRPGSVENCRDIIRLSKKYNAKLLVSSDAHCSNDVGNFGKCMELLKEEEIDEEYIINTNCSKVVEFFAKTSKEGFI